MEAKIRFTRKPGNGCQMIRSDGFDQLKSVIIAVTCIYDELINDWQDRGNGFNDGAIIFYCIPDRSENAIFMKK